jgi:hypothetical protein
LDCPSAAAAAHIFLHLATPEVTSLILGVYLAAAAIWETTQDIVSWLRRQV